MNVSHTTKFVPAEGWWWLKDQKSRTEIVRVSHFNEGPVTSASQN